MVETQLVGFPRTVTWAASALHDAKSRLPDARLSSSLSIFCLASLSNLLPSLSSVSCLTHFSALPSYHPPSLNDRQTRMSAAQASKQVWSTTARLPRMVSRGFRPGTVWDIMSMKGR